MEIKRKVLDGTILTRYKFEDPLLKIERVLLVSELGTGLFLSVES